MSRNAKNKPDRVATELPAEMTQARRFGKTRSAQSGALHEDYVELIADLLVSSGEARPTDIARRLGVAHATAIKTISRLKRDGLATGRPYRGVFLTEAGQALAERMRVRHRLVVNLLVALGVPSEVAEADAEGIEHYVSEATLKAFAQFLQSPRLLHFKRRSPIQPKLMIITLCTSTGTFTSTGTIVSPRISGEYSLSVSC
jgi:DtxR family transcriptional regulator, manganese transport regulator